VAEWEQAYGVTAGISAAGPDRDFSLASVSAGSPLPEAWDGLRRALGFDQVVAARQVHGTRIRIHSEIGPAAATVLDGFDGHLTQRAGVLLAVTVADCVPVFLLEPTGGTMALLHAGWRGVAAGMLEAGVAAMRDAAGVSECDVIMHCGISICGACYEVGPEVLGAVHGRRASAAARLDLRLALAERATELGLGEVTVSSLCTAHSDADLYSHRASRGGPGRMVAYFGRRPA
jgi:hypothetical protein